VRGSGPRWCMPGLGSPGRYSDSGPRASDLIMHGNWFALSGDGTRDTVTCRSRRTVPASSSAAVY
jgi:hypothetical protein